MAHVEELISRALQALEDAFFTFVFCPFVLGFSAKSGQDEHAAFALYSSSHCRYGASLVSQKRLHFVSSTNRKCFIIPRALR